jgi:hypothetical protein
MRNGGFFISHMKLTYTNAKEFAYIIDSVSVLVDGAKPGASAGRAVRPAAGALRLGGAAG